MTNRTLVIKLLSIGVLMLILLIPLAMVSGQITDRKYYNNEAQQRIANSWSGAQLISGPALVIPYESRRVWHEKDDKSGKMVRKTSPQSKQLVLQPKRLSYNTDMEYQRLNSGIYSFPVYNSISEIRGEFDLSELQRVMTLDNFISLGLPWLSMNISDVRGLSSSPVVQFDQQEYRFQPGSRHGASGNIIHAPLAVMDLIASDTLKKRVEFQMNLKLRGSQYFRFLPTADETNVTVSSNWQHPKFIGNYLPIKRLINQDGFSAEWFVAAISVAKGKVKKNDSCDSRYNDCQIEIDNSFGVELIEPVNIYSQSERSTKYAVLFIGLVFVMFFLFEVIKTLPVHPIQYALVGFAQVVFYLMLFALSEHLQFGLSYMISALASILLISWYISSSVRNRKTVAAFFIILSLLYALLYGIVQSEDHAMLMGAILIFAVLSLFMGATRNIDWYKLTSSSDAEKKDVLEHT